MLPQLNGDQAVCVRRARVEITLDSQLEPREEEPGPADVEPEPGPLLPGWVSYRRAPL